MFDSTPLLVPIYKRTHLVAYALISPEDKSVLTHDWTLHREGYATCVSGGGAEKLMHRMVAQPEPGLVVDHINGNRLDNRRENLRNCTQAQNARNTRRIKNKLGARGVTTDTRDGSFSATLGIGNKRYHLGRYPSVEEAAQAYDSAARQIHGEFAVLNYPEVHAFAGVDWLADVIAKQEAATRTRKLTLDMVRDIRVKASAGAPHVDLAAEYGVSAVTIHNIVTFKTHRLDRDASKIEEGLTRMAKGEAGHLVAKSVKVSATTLRKAAQERWGDNPPTTVYKRREGAKLSLQDVQDILNRVAAGEMQKDLAAEYGVTAATVNGYVKHRKR